LLIEYSRAVKLVGAVHGSGAEDEIASVRLDDMRNAVRIDIRDGPYAIRRFLITATG
jgi:hypothetical protein